MAKPLNKPRWASTVTADPLRYVEPPSGKKDAGWDVGERPPAQYENWLRGVTSDWIDWLDTYESTPHTWTAQQTFTPATNVPGIVLGYNSTAAASDDTPSLAFTDGGGTMRAVVDRLGAPAQGWLKREYLWLGTPRLITVGAADTDTAVTGEFSLMQRHSGVGPAVTPNNFQIVVSLPEGGGPTPTLNGYRYLYHYSSFQSFAGQYHTMYGDTICRIDANLRAVAMEFSLLATAGGLNAIGLFKRGLDTDAGLTGRDPFTSPESLFICSSATVYSNRWHVLRNITGVTTATDTGVSIGSHLRVRIEIINDTNLGGPRTNVFINGSNVYTTNTINSLGASFAFGSTHKPVTGVDICSTLLSPVRILSLYKSL